MRIMKLFAFSVMIAAFSASVVLALYLWSLYRDLPDYQHLANYEPPVTSRVHSGTGNLIAEYAIEGRLFVPIEVVPHRVIEAFLAAEDNNFYAHSGINFVSLSRAMLRNVFHYLAGRRLEGASTITQQVAKNFLLTSEVTVERKLKEAMLAFKLERTFSKQELLELYLNEIYLGGGSYGVAAAVLNYFGKPLADITIPEAAYLAALPKAPNNYHPIRQKVRARARRNWVLARMRDNNFISQKQMQTARATPLNAGLHKTTVSLFKAGYFTEEVRREAINLFGDKKLYSGGLSIRTTLNTDYQKNAVATLRRGLVKYDRTKGYRGALRRLANLENWWKQLENIDTKNDLVPWTLAVVLSLDHDSVKIGMLSPQRVRVSGEHRRRLIELGQINRDDIRWVREQLKDDKLGPPITDLNNVFERGDVIWVERFATTDHRYQLRQIPEVNGALVALDPHTGRVLAMVGGFSYQSSEFNRATQARRQPGSAFKPFVYAAALDSGYTPISRVLDAPFVIEQGEGLGLWKPANFSEKFFGLSTLRLGIEQSRNLMTVRLAQQLGMKRVISYAQKFNVFVDEYVAPGLSVALGASETTLMKLVAGYAMLVNGGRKIEPSFIDRVQDRRGKTIRRHDMRECPDCTVSEWKNQLPPSLPDIREEIIPSSTAYQVVSMLEGAMLRGTGVRARVIKKPLGGKTGTTNDFRDAWFVGFSPDLVVGVYVGYDDHRSLGDNEAQGGRLAAPVFAEFMKSALTNTAAKPFRTPENISLVRINSRTGELATPGESSIIEEAFKIGTEPTRTRLTNLATPPNELYDTDAEQNVDGVDAVAQPDSSFVFGGLY